jgi:hypothetical protein
MISSSLLQRATAATGQVAGMAAMPVKSGGKISGPAAICLECLSLCEEIIAEELG